MKYSFGIPLAASLAALALALSVGAARAASPALFDDDMTMGAAKAPVTVIEYASVGCPHCAQWAQTVFPAFKRKYIDSGKVRFVFREMLTGQPSLAAAGFLTARCAGPAHYFAVVEAIFHQQQAILDAGEAFQPLLRIAKQAGMTAEQFSACVQSQEGLKVLTARSDRNAEAGKVDGTPTFVVGERKLDGEQTLADLDAAIAAARQRKAAR